MCERHAALDRSIDLTRKVSATRAPPRVEPRRESGERPKFPSGPASRSGYSFGTHVAIDAGAYNGTSGAGVFHQDRLRLQVYPRLQV
jgi:hypothetical protein